MAKYIVRTTQEVKRVKDGGQDDNEAVLRAILVILCTPLALIVLFGIILAVMGGK